MDSKVIFYILIAVVYYGYQAYKKILDNKKTTEYEPIPEKKEFKKPEIEQKKVTTPYFDYYSKSKEFETNTIEQSSEISSSNAFFPTQIEQGINETDLVPATNYIQNKKNNYYPKNEIKAILNNKKNLKSAFVFNEIMHRKF